MRWFRRRNFCSAVQTLSESPFLPNQSHEFTLAAKKIAVDRLLQECGYLTAIPSTLLLDCLRQNLPVLICTDPARSKEPTGHRTKCNKQDSRCRSSPYSRFIQSKPSVTRFQTTSVIGGDRSKHLGCCPRGGEKESALRLCGRRCFRPPNECFFRAAGPLHE